MSDVRELLKRRLEGLLKESEMKEGMPEMLYVAYRPGHDGMAIMLTEEGPDPLMSNSFEDLEKKILHYFSDTDVDMPKIAVYQLDSILTPIGHSLENLEKLKN
jgi:hypothetical protein